MSTPKVPPKKPPKLSCYPSGNFSLLPTRYVPIHDTSKPPKFSRRIPTSFQLIPVTYPASVLQEERSPVAEGNTTIWSTPRVPITFASPSFPNTPTITSTPSLNEPSTKLDRHLTTLLKLEGYDCETSDSGVEELDEPTVKELLVLADRRESCDSDCEWADTLRRVDRESKQSVIRKKKIRRQDTEGKMLIKYVQ